MLRKLRPRSIYDVMAAIGCFAALATGSAYAANEWTGANIVDSSLTGQDIFPNSVPGGDITNGSLTGADVFDNTIGSADITNGSLTSADVSADALFGTVIDETTLFFQNTLNSADIGDNAVLSPEVTDFTLNDEDVGQGTFVNFAADIGIVQGHNCRDRLVTGINARGDHLLLTPSYEDSDNHLVYGIEYRTEADYAVIHACNTDDIGVDDGITHFNLLVIDAQ